MSVINLKAPPHRHAGFSITELLVVIGIIVLLVGLLLVALGNVRDAAKGTATESTMNSFAAACDAFQLEHGFYPGVVPEQILAEDPQISGTENAMLHLMGGFVRRDDVSDDDWNNNYDAGEGWVQLDFAHSGPNSPYSIKVNTREIGDGPVVNGTPYQPYFTPKETEFGRTVGEQLNEPANVQIPDVLDAWGQPIIYLRQARGRGILVGQIDDKPQFLLESITPYSQSTSLGEKGQDQMLKSMLNVGDLGEQRLTLAQILEHGALEGTPRGAYMLLSAGPDAIFFAVSDGPGSNANPITDVTTVHAQGPRIIDEFDDVRVFGGG